MNFSLPEQASFEPLVEAARKKTKHDLDLSFETKNI